MNVQTYYISHVSIVMWPTGISCIPLLPFTNLLSSPHPLDVHFRISLEIVGHFYLLFYKYCKFGHATMVTLFLNCYIKGKYAISDAATKSFTQLTHSETLTDSRMSTITLCCSEICNG